jgi:dephospho-CoA kinase
MLSIALTGGIATGKSTVCAMLAAKGAVIVDADVHARRVLEPGAEGFEAVVAAFGPGILTVAGEIDRVRLGAEVFGDDVKRRRLEEITHPLIRTSMAVETAEAIDAGAELIVADIPLLFESGREDQFPGVLLVYAPAEVQRHRLAERSGMTAEDIERRLAAQLPIDSKREGSTWVIDNSATIDETQRQVDAWWDAVVATSPDRAT